jgi:TonB dependent receptor
MRALRIHPLRCAAAAALGLVLHLAALTAPGGDDDAGSDRMPWLAPGLRFQAPATLDERYATGEVRWQRQDESSLWLARVSMGPLPMPDASRAHLDAMTAAPPAPSLQGEAQWHYRGWAGHDLRLGAMARHDLLLPQAQAQTLGADLNDEWSLAPGWRLALGLRGDAAPGAATALPPRAALSWQARPGLQLRWVDGLIWRDPQLGPWQDAPTPTRLANGVRLRASEFGVNWQATGGLRLAAALHQRRDAQAVAAAAPGLAAPALRFAQAAPAAPGTGVGVEGDYDSAGGWRLRARWAAFEADAASGNAGARVFAALQAHTALPWRGASAGFEWLRIDQRGAVAGALTQTLLNATLAWAPAGSPWSLAANAYNLADHALDAAGALAPPDVLVREGRRWQVQVARAF